MRLFAPVTVAAAIAVSIAASATPPTTVLTDQTIVSGGTDVIAYHFRIVLPDAGAEIRAAATITFTSATDSLTLDLVGMTVDSVHGGTFAYDGTTLRIATPRPSLLAPRSVSVFYHGVPRDGLIARANARGRRSYFGDNWPNRARFWLPTVDHPSDKARVTWDVIAPPGMEVVTNATGDRAIPTYCMVIGVADMTVSRRGRTEVWAYPEDSAFADSVPFRRAPEILAVMERLVGPYGYQRLAHVQSSTRYGGMENASAIFYAENSYVRRTMGEGVVRHETAHQWFGDAVTQRDWHHVWLSEGFASYFDAVIAQQLDGDSAYWREIRNDRASYLRSQVTGRPIIDTTIADPNRLLNANSYQKGSLVLHMLRGQVGDSAFFRGVRAYYARWRDSTALSSDFQREIERASGQRLDWFFHQWLYQPAYPRLAVTWRWQAGYVVLTVRQAPGPRFRIPRVPLDFGDGRAATFDLDERQAEQTLRFPLAAPPRDVLVDPRQTLLLTAEVRR